MTKQTITLDVEKTDYHISYISYDTVITQIISVMDDYAIKNSILNSITSDFFSLKSQVVALAERLALATETFEFDKTHELTEYNGAAFIRIVPMTSAPGHLLVIKDKNTDTDYVIDMADIVKQVATKNNSY